MTGVELFSHEGGIGQTEHIYVGVWIVFVFISLCILFLIEYYDGFYFRHDGKDGLKFYTDPFYFFELWYQEMEKDVVENMKKQRNKKKVRCWCQFLLWLNFTTTEY